MTPSSGAAGWETASPVSGLDVANTSLGVLGHRNVQNNQYTKYPTQMEAKGLTLFMEMKSFHLHMDVYEEICWNNDTF